MKERIDIAAARLRVEMEEMEKLDQFAGMAMQALLPVRIFDDTLRDIADMAYEAAGYMLEERRFILRRRTNEETPRDEENSDDWA
jgi:hypothetical protein